MSLFSIIRQNYKTGLLIGGGSSILVFISTIIHYKIGGGIMVNIPKHTWLEIAEKLPKLTYFCLGAFVVAFVGTILFWREKGYDICPKCEEVFHKLNLANSRCPKCNVATLDMKTFYSDKNK